MISFLQNEVVFKQSWLTTSQFTDMVAVSQVTPGPVGINMATYTGYMAAGDVWGALVATVAVCLPSFFLLVWLGNFFPAVSAYTAYAGSITHFTSGGGGADCGRCPGIM